MPTRAASGLCNESGGGFDRGAGILTSKSEIRVVGQDSNPDREKGSQDWNPDPHRNSASGNADGMVLVMVQVLGDGSGYRHIRRFARPEPEVISHQLGAGL